MPDSFIVVFPIEPQCVPPLQAIRAGESAFRERVGDAEEVELEITPHPRFIDAGTNWLGVACPSCNSDLEGWWIIAVDEAAESGFQDLDRATPCCGARFSLNDLAYGWPVGFARVTIKAKNPAREPPLDVLRTVVGAAIGTSVRVVVGRV